jgi:hypothetical protein
LTTPDRGQGEKGHLWPEQLPDGRGVIFTTANQDEHGIPKLCIHTPGVPGHRVLIDVGYGARYVPSGHLLYGARGVLNAVTFDLRSLSVTGTPVRIADRLQSLPHDGLAFFDVSRSGTLVYAEGLEIVERSTPLWLGPDSSSNPLKEMTGGGLHFDPAVSPTGEHIVFSVARGSRQDLWIYDISRATWTRLTMGSEEGHMAPVWIGQDRIVYLTKGGLMVIPADGSGPSEPLYEGVEVWPSSWSPSTKLLAGSSPSPTTQGDVVLLDLSGVPRLEPFVATRFRETAPDFSPNGRWLAYQSDESGRNEVYVRPVRRQGSRWSISTNGGAAPRWSRDGRQLFYIHDGNLMAVSITDDGHRLVVGQPVVKTRRSYFGGVIANYATFPDGRVLMIDKIPSPQADRLTVVQDWRALLR